MPVVLTAEGVERDLLIKAERRTLGLTQIPIGNAPVHILSEDLLTKHNDDPESHPHLLEMIENVETGGNIDGGTFN